MSKRNIIELSEFDVTQKIIESLSNVCTRSVLFSIKNESKDVTQIATELKYPFQLYTKHYPLWRILHWQKLNNISFQMKVKKLNFIVAELAR